MMNKNNKNTPTKKIKFENLDFSVKNKTSLASPYHKHFFIYIIQFTQIGFSNLNKKGASTCLYILLKRIFLFNQNVYS